MWPITLTSLVLIAFVFTLYFRHRNHRLQWQCAQRQTEIDSLRAALKQTSERAQAQQEALFNSMAEGVLILDPQQRVRMINKTLWQWFDLKSEMTGHSLIEVFRSHELQEWVQGAASRSADDMLQLELPGSSPRKLLQANAAVIKDPGAEGQGTIVLFRDLSRLKRLENLRQEFVTNVSHELRTPLHIIRGSVETLLEGAENDPQARRRFLQMIQKHTDRLSLLIEDLLTLAPLDAGQVVLNPQRVELYAAAQQVVEDLSLSASRREMVLCNLAAPELYVRADPQGLLHILFNLTDNAIKYGRRQGRVEIGARCADANRVEIWVRDDGPGIPAEAVDRIFERFFRVDRARSREQGGTGLGLSIVKNLAQAQGGEVWVDSRPDQGTSFHFTLPRPT